MLAIQEYLLSVTAAALICTVAKRIAPGGTVGAALKMVTGMLMLLAVVHPWAEIRMADLSEYTADIQNAADHAAAEGIESSQLALREGIIQRVRTYILDKAQTLEADLTVEVELTDDTLPVPCGVTLRGNVSPYARSVLSEYLEDVLGIGSEALRWIS